MTDLLQQQGCSFYYFYFIIIIFLKAGVGLQNLFFIFKKEKADLT